MFARLGDRLHLPLPAAVVCRGIGLLGVKDSAGVSHFPCDLRHTPDADHYRNLMPWVGSGIPAENQWLVQNKLSRTLAKARFSGACRSIFRGTCSRAQLRFVST